MTTLSPSLAKLQPNPNCASLPLFDRKRWERIQLGQVCQEISERINDPSSAGQERFVGLEHFDSGELKIRRWGNTENLESAMKSFSAGDVLFARRNAYLKRASLVDFNGICSGDAIVLRENPKRIIPGFLAFILNTKTFWDFAIANAAGSMSRRVNGTTLMRYEFDLPPLDQQRRIAEIFWAVDEVLEGWRACEVQHSKSLYDFVSGLTLSRPDETTTQNSPIGEIPSSWRCMRLEELIVSSAYGPRFPGSQYTADGNVRTIRTTDFGEFGEINFANVPAATLDTDTISTHRLQDGDFLLSRSGQQAGLTAVFRGQNNGIPYVAGAFLIKYRLRPELNPDYPPCAWNRDMVQSNSDPLPNGDSDREPVRYLAYRYG